MNKKIGIFDSGIGGLTTLEAITDLLPNEDYVYYADRKNNPYGNKSDEELYDIVNKVVRKLFKENVKLIVIACNTATTKCISKLREAYPNMLFVGTEPAIKVACDHNSKNTLVLATPSTISSERTHELVEKNQREGQSIILLPCSGLADAIEQKKSDKILNILKDILTPFEYANIDTVVLGCTHYPIIKETIQKYFKDANIVDGNKGVANRVKDLLKSKKLLNPSKEMGTIKFIKNE